MTNNAQRGEDALKKLEKELNNRDRKQNSKPWTVAALSAVVLVAAGGGIFYLANQPGDDDVETTASESNATSTESTFDPTSYEAIATQRSVALPETVTCAYEEDGELTSAGTPPTTDISTKGTVDIALDTSAGPIGMTLDRSVAPCTVNAIEHLTKEGYFDDSVCHRLTDGDGLRVLQCGDPTGTGAGGPGFQFANEYPTDEALETVDAEIPEGTSPEDAKQYKLMQLQQNPLRYERGTIAMANAGADTNGSQFFLNYGDSILPPLYTYFGKISEEGLATLDKIAETGVEGGAQDGAPAEEVRIKTAKVK